MQVTYEEFRKVVMSTDSKSGRWRQVLQAELLEMVKPHPWAKYELDKLPVLKGTRSRYHAATKTWEQDDVMVWTRLRRPMPTCTRVCVCERVRA